MPHYFAIAAIVSSIGLASAAWSQDTPVTGGEEADAVEIAPAEESLKVFFPTGSARIEAQEIATLEEAARLYRDGSPIVMVVAGGADTVGDPQDNLGLSIRRAQAVADALVARGIPARRLQVLGRGNSELEVKTGDGVSTPENRVVEITWR